MCIGGDRDRIDHRMKQQKVTTYMRHSLTVCFIEFIDKTTKRSFDISNECSNGTCQLLPATVNKIMSLNDKKKKKE